MSAEFTASHSRTRQRPPPPGARAGWARAPGNGDRKKNKERKSAGARAWRPSTPRRRRTVLGAFGALGFNVCLLAAPIAAAGACALIDREQLYSYDLSAGSLHVVRARVEQLAGRTILLDFDRRRQWDDLIARELIEGDVAAARGYLLSARGMLSAADASALDRRLRKDAPDAAIELAALELLTPGTRNRYEATAPLLSRRGVSRAPRFFGREADLGGEQEFVHMAGVLTADPGASTLGLTITGLALGLGEPLTPRMSAGAGAIVAALSSSAPPATFGTDLAGAAARAAAPEAMRQAMLKTVQGENPHASFAQAARAFQGALDPEGVRAFTVLLDQAGEIVEATSLDDAARILGHAREFDDLARLRQVAAAARDRASASAQAIAHDGALPGAAYGVVRVTDALVGWLAAFSAAAAALIIGAACYVADMFGGARTREFRSPDDDESDTDDLIEAFGAPQQRS